MCFLRTRRGAHHLNVCLKDNIMASSSGKRLHLSTILFLSLMIVIEIHRAVQFLDENTMGAIYLRLSFLKSARNWSNIWMTLKSASRTRAPVTQSTDVVRQMYAKGEASKVHAKQASGRDVNLLPPTYIATICTQGIKRGATLQFGGCLQSKDFLQHSVGTVLYGLSPQMVMSKSWFYKVPAKALHWSQSETPSDVKHLTPTLKSHDVHKHKGSMKGLSRAGLHQWIKLLQTKQEDTSYSKALKSKLQSKYVRVKRAENNNSHSLEVSATPPVHHNVSFCCNTNSHTSLNGTTKYNFLDTDPQCNCEKMLTSVHSRKTLNSTKKTGLTILHKRFNVSNFRVTNDTVVDEESHCLLIQGLYKPHLRQSTTIDMLFHGESMLTSSIFVTLLAFSSSDLKKKVKSLFSRRCILHGKKTFSEKGEVLNWTSSLFNFDFFRPPRQDHVIAPVTSFLPPVGTSQKNVLSYEGVRLMSLNSLPSTCKASRVRLASAGFYYDTTKTDRNAHNLHEVVCYSCGLSYAEWEDGVNPLAVHRELSPQCSHLKEVEQAACPTSFSTTSSKTDHVSKKTISAARNDGRPPNYGLMGGNPDFSTTTRSKQLQLSADSSLSSKEINSVIIENKNRNTSSFSKSAGESIYARPGGCEHKGGNPNSSEFRIDDSLETDCAASLPVLQPEPRAAAQGASSGIRENGFATVKEQADATGEFRCGASQTSVTDFDDRPPLSSGNAVYPNFATTQSRFATFYGWPLGDIFPPQLLVSYGFYFAGYADCIRCFYCGIGLKSWQHDDNVLQEHIRWRPNCGFLLATKGRRFVNNVLANLQNTETQAKQDRTRDNQTTSVSVVNTVVQQPFVSDAPRQFEKIQNGSAPSHSSTDATTTTSTSNVSATTLQTLREMGFDKEKTLRVIRELQESGSPVMDVDTLVERLVEIPKENGPTRTQDLSTDGPDQRADRFRTLKEENERLKERKRCKVCRTSTVGMIFLPCGHVVACTQCGAKIRHCTSCGQFVRATANVFLS